MTRISTTRHIARSQSRLPIDAETFVVQTAYAKEIYTRFPSLPAAAIDREVSLEEQAHTIYDCLPDILKQYGASLSNVVLERLFFNDLLGDLDLIKATRRQAYAKGGVSAGEMPAPTFLHQPPCRPGQAFELQTYTVVPNSLDSAKVETPLTADVHTYGKIVQLGDRRHLYITMVDGWPEDGRPIGSFRQQSDAMFAKMPRLLAPFGLKFVDVVRTWCYLDEMDRDYAEFNLSRNAFFKQEGVVRMPASTGIRSGLQPKGTLCSTDMYVLMNPEGIPVEPMHTPTLNEACEYGSSFARGMMVDLPEKMMLYVSGTASVDEHGATVHVDDFPKQVDRMLLNIEELLKPYGATFDDVVQGITYLKSADTYGQFQKIMARWGLQNVPNTIVEAGVCRPDLLCEMEAIAILPKL